MKSWSRWLHLAAPLPAVCESLTPRAAARIFGRANRRRLFTSTSSDRSWNPTRPGKLAGIGGGSRPIAGQSSGSAEFTPIVELFFSLSLSSLPTVPHLLFAGGELRKRGRGEKELQITLISAPLVFIWEKEREDRSKGGGGGVPGEESV